VVTAWFVFFISVAVQGLLVTLEAQLARHWAGKSMPNYRCHVNAIIANQTFYSSCLNFDVRQGCNQKNTFTEANYEYGLTIRKNIKMT